MAANTSKSAEALLVLLYRLSGDGAGPVAGEEARRLFGEGFNKALLELLRANCLSHGTPAGTIALSGPGQKQAWTLRMHGNRPVEPTLSAGHAALVD